MYQVFVYGTLKEGFPNYRFNKGQRISGSFITKHRYPLYIIASDDFCPWLVFDEGQGYCIKGQLFSVSADALQEMDELEQITLENGYRRSELAVISETTGEEQLVFVYGRPLEHLATADIHQVLSDEYTLEHASLYCDDL